MMEKVRKVDFSVLYFNATSRIFSELFKSRKKIPRSEDRELSPKKLLCFAQMVKNEKAETRANI